MKFFLLTLCLVAVSNAVDVDLSMETPTPVGNMNKYGPFQCTCNTTGCDCLMRFTNYPEHSHSAVTVDVRPVDYDSFSETFTFIADRRTLFPASRLGSVNCNSYTRVVTNASTTNTTITDRQLITAGLSSASVHALCTVNGQRVVVDYLVYVYVTPANTACMDSALSMNCAQLAMLGACDSTIPSSVAASTGMPCASLMVRDVCPYSCGCCSVDGKCVCDMKYLMYGMTCQSAAQRFSCSPQSMMGNYLWKLCPCTCKRMMNAPTTPSESEMNNNDDDMQIAPGKTRDSVMMH